VSGYEALGKHDLKRDATEKHNACSKSDAAATRLILARDDGSRCVQR
jgi:hypothetical protein